MPRRMEARCPLKICAHAVRPGVSSGLRRRMPAEETVRLLVFLDTLVAYFKRRSALPVCIVSSWTKVTSTARGDVYTETVKQRGGRVATDDSIHGQALDAGARALGASSRHELNLIDVCAVTDAPPGEDNPHREPSKALLQTAVELFARHILPVLLQLQPLLIVQQEECCRHLLAAMRKDDTTYAICPLSKDTVFSC